MDSPRLLASALAVGLLSHAALGLAARQAPTFRGDTRFVPVYATVVDRDRRLVPGLTRDDFEVFADGKPRPITVFSNEIEPITVVVMLDTSASMTPNLGLVTAGAEQFFLRLLPGDQAVAGAFNDKIEFASDFTSDRDELIASLRSLDFGNPTRLYDAVALSLEQLQRVEGRKVVLVFTDGADTSSSASLGDVLARARAEEVMVYAIGLEADYFNGVRQVRSKPDRGLRKLAEETGGGYFELDKKDLLTSTFTRVSEELHSQYLIGFDAGARDGKVHKLEVRVKKAGATARARKSYVG
ncbi:MAG TPA: VWA domain-containing protein [Vicinamibacterales bacterium]|nr:VWA domain-containing protein [Acidobacteriota bacterium]HOC16953.1 VWA domain-containing protein [Vicinamibacterales bacterium]